MKIRSPQRAGQALVEFGLVAMVLYMIVGAAITFGLWIYAAGQIQQAANVGARELSLTPLPFDATFEDALQQRVVRRRVYDERWLVIDLDQLEQEIPDYDFFRDVVPRMPMLNQQLAVLYIRDDICNEQDDVLECRSVLRYPGALLDRNDDPATGEIDYPDFVATDLAVQIPIVVNRAEGHDGGGGAERIRWVNVVEEIDSEELPDDNDGDNPDPFSLENVDEDDVAADTRGVVALRIHYPAQSTWLSSFRDRGNFVANGGDPDAANDNGVQVLNADAAVGSILDRPLVQDNVLGDAIYAGTNGGQYGLGIHGAMTSPTLTGDAIGIRPFRRVLISHAIFRREAFTPRSTSGP